jgi:hypothetical protein
MAACSRDTSFLFRYLQDANQQITLLKPILVGVEIGRQAMVSRVVEPLDD